MAKAKPKKQSNLKSKRPLLVALLLGVVLGFLLSQVKSPPLHPRNLVWASDKFVEVPKDLASFLKQQDKCRDLRTGDALQGVGLWSVYQVSKGKFAKVAYGCGVALTRYVMAVKTDQGWRLLEPADYFANNRGRADAESFLPQCSVIKQYRIDKSIEPFCIDAGGKAKQNPYK